MEDNAIRAIMIGVSLFVIILTLSGILVYVNLAKDMATAANKTLNSWDDIDIYNVMDYDGDITIDVTGSNLINFITKYVKDTRIRIKLGQFTVNNDPSSFEDITNWRNNLGNASEEKLMNINPNAKLRMIKTENADGKIYIEVVGDIWIIKQAEAGILYGDINLDGNVDLLDYEALENYLNFDFSNEEKLQADVTGDGVIDYEDVKLLNEYLDGMTEIKPGTGDVTGNGNVNRQDYDYLRQHILTTAQRESIDLNLDRVINNDDLNKLKEILIEKGIIDTELDDTSESEETDDEGIKFLADYVRVGDYVEYIPMGSSSCTNAQISGGTTSITRADNVYWQVLNFDRNTNKVTLISEKGATNEVTIVLRDKEKTGATATAIDTVCNTLFNNTTLASVVRGAKKSDFTTSLMLKLVFDRYALSSYTAKDFHKTTGSCSMGSCSTTHKFWSEDIIDFVLADNTTSDDINSNFNPEDFKLRPVVELKTDIITYGCDDSEEYNCGRKDKPWKIEYKR